MKKITFLIFTFLFSTISFSQVYINEIDADQTGTDDAEFIELKTDNPNTSLDGYVVVLFNGSSDQSYAAYDLDGFSTNSDGFLLLANDGFPGMDISLGADNGLQNGADAVVIYQADADDFPNETPVTATNLIDAIVYDTNDDDDEDLLSALGETIQYDEDENGERETESIQRDEDGSFCVGVPTPKVMNIDCSGVCPLNVYIVSVECDDLTAETDTYTTTLAFEDGATEQYTVTSTEGTVGGDNPSDVESGVITITGVEEGVDFSYSVSSVLCDFTNDITAPDCNAINTVSTIAELRAGTIDENYMLTGEAVLTYQQDYRNQKYIEDESAGILLDDDPGVITTDYTIGDGITGIMGTLDEFNGILQFHPIEDPGAATSTENAVTPQVITISDFNNSPESYESEMIAFVDVNFTDADGTAIFNTGANYTLSNGSETTTMRTNFYDESYIETVIPSSTVNVVGIGAQYEDNENNVTPQIFATDVDASLGTKSNAQINFSLYPNPAKGQVTIQTETTNAVQVEVFDILGKQVIAKKVSNGNLNISSLNAGLYLVKVTQNGVASTKKLIVK